MLPILQNGWLLLLLCAGVVLLLMGCASLSTRTPAQNTPYFPIVTLTVVPFSESPQPYSTLLGITTEPNLPPPGWLSTRTTSSGTLTDDPNCYNSPNHGYTCLGQIQNLSSDTLTNIILTVSLFGDSGSLLEEQTVTVEQHYMPPNTSAPYRAHFEQINSPNNTVHTEVQNLHVIDLQDIPIAIVGERGVLANNGRYVVTANLQNTSERRVEAIRMIVTVLDFDDRVVGYRIQSIDPMQAGAERAVRMEVIPQVTDKNLYHRLHIEARTISTSPNEE